MSRFTSSLLLTALLLTGCEAIPVSQHPLSDETNSEIDVGLIGMWDIIDVSREAEPPAAAAQPAEAAAEEEGPQAEPAADPERPPRFAIGRRAGQERSLEMASLHLVDDHVEVKRFPLHATKVGKQALLSVRANPEEMTGDFVLLRYEIANENRILVYFLSREEIAKSIQRGELKGVVRKAAPKDPNNPNAEQRKEEIRITAAAAELRDYLAKHEKTAFDPRAVWRLQRAAGN